LEKEVKMAFVAESAVKYPFSFDVRGNVVMTTSQQEIWANRVYLGVSTAIGERVMRPTYGTSISETLFDTQSAVEENLRKDISSLFANEFSLLVLNDVTVSFDQGTSTLTADINYTIPNQTEQSVSVGVVTINGNNPAYEENL
jgi:phage baseplate assembly protein W